MAIASNTALDRLEDTPVRGAFTQLEWARFQEDLAKEQPRKTPPSLVESQAVVSAENLVSDQYWRVYQQTLQAKIELAGAEIAELQQRASDPGMLDYQQIIADKMQIARIGGQKEAWEQAIAMPGEIIDSAETSRTK